MLCNYCTASVKIDESLSWGLKFRKTVFIIKIWREEINSGEGKRSFLHMKFYHSGIFLFSAFFLAGGLTAAAEMPQESVPGTEAAAPALQQAPEKEKKAVEVQLEYMDHRLFHNRHIDNYSIHVYQEWKKNGSVSLHKGLTLTRGLGYLRKDNDPRHRDSRAVGFGPSFMLRWQRQLSGKLYGGIDATGSFLIYDHVFPADSRTFGFMWRTGPRLSYKWNEDDSLTLGYSVMHCSNGMKTRNLGYNGVGFMLGYQHRF